MKSKSDKYNRKLRNNLGKLKSSLMKIGALFIANLWVTGKE